MNYTLNHSQGNGLVEGREGLSLSAGRRLITQRAATTRCTLAREMAYDEELAHRLREQLAGEEGVTWARRGMEFTRTLPPKV